MLVSFGQFGRGAEKFVKTVYAHMQLRDIICRTVRRQFWRSRGARECCAPRQTVCSSHQPTEVLSKLRGLRPLGHAIHCNRKGLDERFWACGKVDRVTSVHCRMLRGVAALFCPPRFLHIGPQADSAECWSITTYSGFMMLPLCGSFRAV